ncbi:MAG: acetolactate synthase [Planctomycetes bacterium]|nr:acetolactate synthase [Planctomycetota bacterium]MBI3832882.1 acetolactate synthase [Planctomycetota bacterium]
MQLEPVETAHGHDLPTVRQLSVFIENRVGQLLRLTRMFDQTDIRILAVSVVYSVDCAIVRIIVNDPNVAQKVLADHDFKVSETELIVVSLPHGKRALLHTWAALLTGEVNVHYTYPLMVQPHGLPAIAVAPDNIEQAIQVLRDRKFDVLSQQDLLDTKDE